GPAFWRRLRKALGSRGRSSARRGIPGPNRSEDRGPPSLCLLCDGRPRCTALPALWRPRARGGTPSRAVLPLPPALSSGGPGRPAAAPALQAMQSKLEACPRGSGRAERIPSPALARSLVRLRCSGVDVLAGHPLRFDDEGSVACGNLAFGLIR